MGVSDTRCRYFCVLGVLDGCELINSGLLGVGVEMMGSSGQREAVQFQSKTDSAEFCLSAASAFRVGKCRCRPSLV